MVRRHPGGLQHVLLQILTAESDDHAPAAQHIAGAHQQREAQLPSDAESLVQRQGGAGLGVVDAQAVQQLRKALAVLGQVDGLGLSAHDVHAAGFQVPGQLQRRLAAQRHHHALRLLNIDDVHDILKGQRLKI